MPSGLCSKDTKSSKALEIPLPTRACLSTTPSKLTAHAQDNKHHILLLTISSIQYPMIVDFEEVQLLDTYYGQFGRDGEAPGGQDIGNVFAWPLIWTNSWTGEYSYLILSPVGWLPTASFLKEIQSNQIPNQFLIQASTRTPAMTEYCSTRTAYTLA